MNMIQKLIAKQAVDVMGECVDKGHRMKYTHHKQDGWSYDRYDMHFKCEECGYTATRRATSDEVNAIRKIKNAEYKKQY
jgi:hypothetical protein